MTYVSADLAAGIIAGHKETILTTCIHLSLIIAIKFRLRHSKCILLDLVNLNQKTTACFCKGDVVHVVITVRLERNMALVLELGTWNYLGDEGCY